METSASPGNTQLTGSAAETYSRLNDVEVVPPDKIGFAGLTAESFIELLVTELQNQDPLEPVSNEQIINQLSAVQSLQSNVELSNAIELMTQTLGSPSSGQQLSTASTFIGHSVTGKNSLTGIVDRAFLQDGEVHVGIGNMETALDAIASINTTRSLVGKLITGKNAVGDDVIGIVGAAAQEDGVDYVSVDGALVRLADVSSVNTAGSLVGKVVGIQAGEVDVIGEVQQVVQRDDEPLIVVGGQYYALSDVTNLTVGTTVLP